MNDIEFSKMLFNYRNKLVKIVGSCKNWPQCEVAINCIEIAKKTLLGFTHDSGVINLVNETMSDVYSLVSHKKSLYVS